MKRWMILILALALPQGTAQMDHSTMHMGMQMGSTMEMGGLEKLAGKVFDRAFLSMMVPHHQQAVEMAKAVLDKGKDAQVRKWASKVIKDQQQEIQSMQSLLKSMGGPDSKMAQVMQKSMSGMADQVRKAKDPDRAFVEGMIPHHASAIHMANMALEISDQPQVLKLARDIVVAQAAEIHQFKNWLKQ